MQYIPLDIVCLGIILGEHGCDCPYCRLFALDPDKC
jgi:hypothetical protein